MQARGPAHPPAPPAAPRDVWRRVCGSYNAINGEPACTNKALVGGLLRGEFNFSGVVATDCGALRDAYQHHHRYKDGYAVVTAAVRAGVDSNCGSEFSKSLPAALDPASGHATGLTEAELDKSVARLLAARFKLGLFDAYDRAHGVPAHTIADVDTAAHRSLALKAARQGIILLQNPSSAAAALPLSATAFPKLAMIGPNANASMNLLSGYHGSAPADLLRSPLQHMRAIWAEAGGHVAFARGCNVSDDRGKTPPAVVEAGLAAAVEVAKGADAVVLGLGLCGDNYGARACTSTSLRHHRTRVQPLHATAARYIHPAPHRAGGGPPKEDPTCFTITESEGTDRVNLTLPGAQMDLFRRVRALGIPVVVFLMNAGPVDVSEIASTAVPIVAAGYGGEFGGQATGEVLAGKYNPGGALTTTVYRQAYAQTTSFQDMSMRPGSAGNPAGRTYKFLNDASLSLWSFGHGESYSTFSLAFSQEPRLLQGDVTLTVELSNTGALAGDCAVTCFVSVGSAGADDPPPPKSSLFDFARAEAVAPKEKRTLSFTLEAHQRERVGFDGRPVLPAAGTTYNVQCRGLGDAKTAVKQIVV